jgi:RecB family exonuclease
MDAGSNTLTGTLVHRLFERVGTTLAATADRGAIVDELARLLRDEESVEVDDVEHVFRYAREAYLALCAQPELSEALASGEALFEVPFSVRPAASRAILRGTFDCLVRLAGGAVTVIELKTRKPAPEHQQQLSTYLTAARALFPGATVEGKLVYARQAKVDDRPFTLTAEELSLEKKP